MGEKTLESSSAPSLGIMTVIGIMNNQDLKVALPYKGYSWGTKDCSSHLIYRGIGSKLFYLFVVLAPHERWD